VQKYHRFGLEKGHVSFRETFEAPDNERESRVAGRGSSTTASVDFSTDQSPIRRYAAKLMNVTLYTLVGLRSDGISLAVDVVAASSLDHAKEKARRFLAEHASCATVEISSAGESLAVVHREEETDAA